MIFRNWELGFFKNGSYLSELSWTWMQTFQRKHMLRQFDLKIIKTFSLNKEQKISNVKENCLFFVLKDCKCLWMLLHVVFNGLNDTTDRRITQKPYGTITWSTPTFFLQQQQKVKYLKEKQEKSPTELFHFSTLSCHESAFTSPSFVNLVFVCFCFGDLSFLHVFFIPSV